MKKQISLFLLLVSIVLLNFCKKDSGTNETNSPQTIFTSPFDSQSDLNGWIQSSGGQAIIDNGAVKFQNITECFHFETSNLIAVQQGKNYILKINGKVNQSITGDPGLCVGDFMIYVVQGDTDLISESFGNYPDWTLQSYSFTPKSSSAVKIKILIGTTRGAWIDKLELIQN